MLSHLEVKNLSLGEEIKIIHAKERRVRRARPVNEVEYWSLFKHRQELRSEVRSSFLAYGFLRGVPYKAIEKKLRPSTPQPNWDRVQSLIVKFGVGTKTDLIQRFEQWKQEAEGSTF